MRDVHVRALRRYYKKPSALPDIEMLKYPFWSTWAQYKEDINQTLVLEMARRMLQEGYTINSHIEIDDDWEICYGQAEFNPQKFPDPAGKSHNLIPPNSAFKRQQVDCITKLTCDNEINFSNDPGTGRAGHHTDYHVDPSIHKYRYGMLAFAFTGCEIVDSTKLCWVSECPSFDVAFANGYFLKDTKSKQGITWWWQGANSGLIDYSNENAVNWWRARLERLQREYNITSYKCNLQLIV